MRKKYVRGGTEESGPLETGGSARENDWSRGRKESGDICKVVIVSNQAVNATIKHIR